MGAGLLLIHGWPLDGSMWDRQVAALNDEATVLAPDLPGFGGTLPSGNVMGMDAAADACHSVAKEFGMDRFVVCGLSMGGYVAFSMWRRHRDSVAGLVLANTRAVADPPGAAQARRRLAARLRREGIGFFLDDPPPLLSERAPMELVDRVRGIIRGQRPEAIAAAAEGMADRRDSTPDLTRIDVPTLVIASSGDRLIPPEVSAAPAAEIPGARLEWLEGAGHLSNLEAPDEFTNLLREHLAVCGVTPGRP